jgi:nucleolar MIF4G domain-containing protein 1
LDLLKTVNFVTCSSELSLFVELFFVTVFQILGKKAEKGCKKSGSLTVEWDTSEVSRLVTSIKNTIVLKGIEYFLVGLEKSSFLTSAKQKERVLWASKWTLSLVAEINDRNEI